MTEEVHTPQSVRDWLGYLTPGELAALIQITAELPPDPNVVNLGAGGGTSGLTFAHTRADLNLWTVDVQDESDPKGCLEGERAVMESAGLWPHPRLHQIHGDSTDAAFRYEWPELDLVFHDSDHTKEKVQMDVLAWVGHLRSGGLFVFHDYGDHRHVDVKPVADKYMKEFGAELELLVERIAAFRMP